MVFCNMLKNSIKFGFKIGHNPYFNRWFSAIQKRIRNSQGLKTVTILILIDGFLQFIDEENIKKCIKSHNPYFNRWFSAI